jgi:hypothetical protein
MNIPRTRPLVRSNTHRSKSAPKKQNIPDGVFTAGIYNEEIAALVGRIVAELPHVEEHMIAIMALLLGHSAAPARQIFRSLNSEDARVKVMRALLETYPGNLDKGQEYDDLIDLFVEIKNRRNAYSHGLWQTHSSGRTFLAEPTADEYPSFLAQREIKKGELIHGLDRIAEFVGKSHAIRYPEIVGKDGKIRPSLKKSPKPPIEAS